MHSRFLKPIALCLVTLLMIFNAGCSLVPPQADDKAALTANRGKPLIKDHWSVHSKIGFKTSEESGSAGLSWLQDGNAYDIKLLDPLGRSLGQVVSDGQTVEFKSKEHNVTADSVDDVVFRLLGRPFPVAELNYWIKGLNAPLLAVEPLSASEQHLEFNQADWLVKMSKFTIEDGYRLPSKLKLSYPSNTVEPVFELKIAIKTWTIIEDAK